ncbi:MAG: hypothetical protein WCF30_03085 [Terracidiphilus sp.]
MSDDQRQEITKQDTSNDEPATGPSLALLYSLIALALAAAIGLAALIVRPFYLRR